MELTSIERTFQEMGRILTDLCRQSDNMWRNQITLDGKTKVSKETRFNYDSLKDLRYKITKEAIQKEFKENSSICKLKFNHLYLPPLENDYKFVPILSIDCDLKNEEGCQMSLRVEMLRYDSPHELIGFGFRFESPHSKGNHGYWHMQVITENNGIKLGCSPWIPVEDPCIPIKAKNPVDLILFMLISFYGLRGLKIINSWNLEGEYMKQVYDIFPKPKGSP